MTQDQTHKLKKCKALPYIELRKADHSYTCYHTHSHDEFSFGVIDKGKAVYKNGNKKNNIESGTTVTINPGDAHSCNPKEEAWSYRMIFIKSEWVKQLQSEIINSFSYDYLPFQNQYEKNLLIYNSFSLLFEKLFKDNSPHEAEALLIEFLGKLFLKGSTNPAKYQKTEILQLKIIKEMISDRLDMNISLNEFSDNCGLSRYHLIRSFKKAYGLTPHAFQLDRRIIKAKLLLKEGVNIVDTAGLLGFSDQSHFQRNFKKRLAVTPKQYQSFFI